MAVGRAKARRLDAPRLSFGREYAVAASQGLAHQLGACRSGSPRFRQVQGIHSVILLSDPFPLRDHTFARNELLSLPLGRQVLGDREVNLTWRIEEHGDPDKPVWLHDETIEYQQCGYRY
jgi:hypothetical protein